MEKFIPLSVPNIMGNEKKYIMEALESEWVSTAGPFVNRFEKEIAAYLKVDGAVACQSGTAGIHLALLALGIDSCHEVIAPALTFIAAINPIKYVGAEPIFMDCDDSLCIDPEKVNKFCLEECNFDGTKLINKKTKKHIKALLAVHVFGNMADMEKLTDIAKQYNLNIIEDATEALGTKYTVGRFENMFAGTIGDVGVYSFNGNKIITTGGGGMVVAKSKTILDRVKYLSTQAKDDDVYFIHNEIGYNYRMTNIQAAMGVAQLEQLENFIAIKCDNYHLYEELLNDLDEVRLISFRNDIRPNYWFYSLLFNNNDEKVIHDAISRLSDNLIQSRPIWALICNQKPYQKNEKYQIERSTEFVERVLSIPCSTNLTEEEAKKVANAIKELRDNDGFQ